MQILIGARLSLRMVFIITLSSVWMPMSAEDEINDAVRMFKLWRDQVHSHFSGLRKAEVGYEAWLYSSVRQLELSEQMVRSDLPGLTQSLVNILGDCLSEENCLSEEIPCYEVFLARIICERSGIFPKDLLRRHFDNGNIYDLPKAVMLEFQKSK